MNTKYVAVLAVCCAFFFLFSAKDIEAKDKAEKAVFAAHTLEAYIQRSLDANPGLKMFKARYQAALERVPQAASLPDPMFQITHFVESVQTRTGPQENVFMLSQRIPWFGKLSSSEQAASAEAQALWHAYQNQQLLLVRKVSLAFFEYGFTGRAITLTRKNLDWLTQLEPIIEEQVKGGGDINPLLRLKVEVGKIADKLESLKQRRIVQSARITEMLALPETTLIEWPRWDVPPVDVVDGRTLVGAIEGNNPELQMLKRKIASGQARQESARLASYPDVTVGINYIQIGDPVVNPATPDAGADPWGVTATITIPLWFDKNEAARAEALAGKQAYEHEYEKTVNALKAEMRASIALLHDADRRLQFYGKELLGLAEQAAENSRAGYEAGRTGILEVIDSERSLLELHLLSWRAAADAWQQRVTIQTLANQPVLGNEIPEIK